MYEPGKLAAPDWYGASYVTPGELGDRQEHPGAPGNKAAFLRVARGLMTEPEAARLQELIDESCERIDE